MGAVEVTWTIAELAEHAAEVLETSPQRANGRVRDVPNERLIRWYATVGLVDPPLSRRGRVARYGERHLLQLVAVKRRQAEGRSLAEIQEELAGATDEVLAAVAGLQGSPAPDAAREAPAAAPAAADRFWARQARQARLPGTPDPAVSSAAVSSAAVSAAAVSSAADPAAGDLPGRRGPGLVRGVRLAPGVVLLLETADREPGPEDITALMNAAHPLLQELADRGLACPPEDPPA